MDISALYAIEEHRNGEGLTVREWSDKSGIPYHRTQRIIKKAVQGGKMVLDERFVPNDWDGRSRRYKVYRWAE